MPLEKSININISDEQFANNQINIGEDSSKKKVTFGDNLDSSHEIDESEFDEDKNEFSMVDMGDNEENKETDREGNYKTGVVNLNNYIDELSNKNNELSENIMNKNNLKNLLNYKKCICEDNSFR